MNSFIYELTYLRLPTGITHNPSIGCYCEASPIDAYNRLLFTHRVSSLNGVPLINPETIVDSGLTWISITNEENKRFPFNGSELPLEVIATRFFLSKRTIPFFQFNPNSVYGFANNP